MRGHPLMLLLRHETPALLPHDGVLSGKLEFTGNARGLVAAVLEDFASASAIDQCSDTALARAYQITSWSLSPSARAAASRSASSISPGLLRPANRRLMLKKMRHGRFGGLRRIGMFRRPT